MSLRNSGREADTDSRWTFFLGLALAVGMAIYAARFYQGGREFISPDGERYLALARAEAVPGPFDGRVLKPKAAAMLASACGVSPQTAFHILTPIELFLSLLLLGWLVRKRGGSAAAVGTIVLVFGAQMGAIFGGAPVLVDPALLLFTCLFLISIEFDHLALALICACLGVLTKEYGVLLVVVWGVEMLRRRRLLGACLGVGLPLAALAANKLAHGGGGAGHYLRMLAGATRFMAGGLTGPNGLKILYFWLWAAMWPLMPVAILMVIARWKANSGLAPEHWRFVAILGFVPFLLTGDWDRSLMIVVPFVCSIVAGSGMVNHKGFLVLFAIGGLATALARSGVASLPALKVLLMAANLLATLCLLVTMESVLKGLKDG